MEDKPKNCYMEWNLYSKRQYTSRQEYYILGTEEGWFLYVLFVSSETGIWLYAIEN